MVLLHSWSAPWEKIIEYFQYRYKTSKENITLVKQYAVCDIDKYLKKTRFIITTYYGTCTVLSTRENIISLVK